MSSLPSRLIKLKANISAQERFVDQIVHFRNQYLDNDETSHEVNFTLIQAVEVAVKDIHRIKDELAETLDDFVISELDIQISGIKLEKIRGKTKLAFTVELEQEAIYCLEVMESIFKDNKLTKEKLIESFDFTLNLGKLLNEENENSMLERAAQLFDLPTKVKVSDIGLYEKIGNKGWLKCAEIARFQL